MISNSGISNIVIIVVRYFGGVLLGTGGLVRAYTQAAQEAVNAAEKKTICLSNIYDIDLEYGDFDKVKYLLDNAEGVSYEVGYTEKVVIHAIIPERIAEEVTIQISEKTAGKCGINYIETKMI